jgi:hypothetical protein
VHLSVLFVYESLLLLLLLLLLQDAATKSDFYLDLQKLKAL